MDEVDRTFASAPCLTNAFYTHVAIGSSDVAWVPLSSLSVLCFFGIKMTDTIFLGNYDVDMRFVFHEKNVLRGVEVGEEIEAGDNTKRMVGEATIENSTKV